MRYFVNVGGLTREVSVQFNEDRIVSVTLDGDAAAGEFELTDTHTFVMRDGARRLVGYAAPSSSDPTSVDVALGNERYRFEVLAEREYAVKRKSASSAQADTQLLAPMPGRIVSLSVQPGQSVSAGDALVVIEAMKMENELTAVSDATVDQISVSTGQSVEMNQVLLTFKPPT